MEIPSESDPQKAGSQSFASGATKMGARLGDAVLTVFDFFDTRCSSLTGRLDAVLEGMWGAFWKVAKVTLLAGLIYLFSGLLAGLFQVGGQAFAKAVDLRFGWWSGGEISSAQWSIGVVIWLVAAGSAVLQLWIDVPKKGFVLNWAFFGLVAGATLMSYGPWPIYLAALIGEGYVHAMMHTALRRRHAAIEFAHEAVGNEVNLRSQGPAKPGLAERYRGVSGFGSDEDPV